MKIAAWHKKNGDAVEWYDPLFSGRVDRVYMSKVFSFTPDYEYNVNAAEIIRGGSGYRIKLIDGREVYDAENDKPLPYEVEHIYPDYSIYFDIIPETRDTAYGFLTRGCPRGCAFCHVACKEGRRSYKVADLSEFWDGQKNIVLCDPNITAARECLDLFDQLIESNACVEFNQGLDIRLMTPEKADKLRRMKTSKIHFAWDRYKDKEVIVPKFREFREVYGGGDRQLQVYVLANFDSTFEQDLERCYTLRDMGYAPYLTIYDKEHLAKNDPLRRAARYVNNRYIFNAPDCKTFEDYIKGVKQKEDADQLKLF